MQTTTTHSRAGFSLLEILVALVLIGLLVGTLLPSVLGQMGRGEANRVVEDLRAVENAAKTFRVDVNRWPGDLEDLTTAISSTDTPLSGTYSAGLITRWSGPYIEAVEVTDGGTLPTAAGGELADDFTTTEFNGADYLTVSVEGLETGTIEAVDEVIDGTPSLTAGRVQTDPLDAATLIYLAAPVN